MFWNSRLLIAQVTAGTVVNTTVEDMAKDMADTAASALTEDTSATVIQDTIKAMEITSEATVDTIENSVNIVTHTKCIDCNHASYQSHNCLNIASSLSFLYNIIFKCVERNSIIFQVMQIARVDLNKKKKWK